jgi:hypothetical protein
LTQWVIQHNAQSCQTCAKHKTETLNDILP